MLMLANVSHQVMRHKRPPDAAATSETSLSALKRKQEAEMWRPVPAAPPCRRATQPGWLGFAGTGRFTNQDGLHQPLASPRLARPFAPGVLKSPKHGGFCRCGALQMYPVRLYGDALFRQLLILQTDLCIA